MSPTSIRSVLAVLLVLGGIAVASVVQSRSVEGQDQAKSPRQAETEPQTMMMCPMMAGLRGIELHVDSPVLLLARAEELGITAEQREQIEEIAEAARQEAREVLTDEQRDRLAREPQGPLSPMQISMLRMRERMREMQQPQMCPMCRKMMQERMQERMQE